MTNGGGCKPIATFLAGVVLTMIAFYVAEFRRTITRDDAAQLIQDMRPGPPWVQDRGRVMDALDRHQRALEGCIAGKQTP